MDLVQLALITHVLGLDELGRLALVLSFVVLVGQFFDLRIGTAVTTFGARRLATGDLRGLAGATQFGYLLDATTGILGFAVVAALAPIVGPSLIGDQGTLLILLYGLTLLASTTNESSVSILRLFDRFRLVAFYSIGLESARVVVGGFRPLLLREPCRSCAGPTRSQCGRCHRQHSRRLVGIPAVDAGISWRAALLTRFARSGQCFEWRFTQTLSLMRDSPKFSCRRFCSARSLRPDSGRPLQSGNRCSDGDRLGLWIPPM